MLNSYASPIQVHLVALPMTRWGLERLVQTAHPRLEVSGMAASVEESLPLLSKEAADIILVDLDGGDPPESLIQFHPHSRAKLLVITGSRDSALHDSAVHFGARGVVQKRESPSILLKAIEKVYEGELWIDRSATSRIFMELARQKAAQGKDPEVKKIAALTSRERQTIAAVASNAAAPGKVVAQSLHISEHTLRNHLTSVYSKLGLCNRVDLYAYAHRHGLNQLGA